MVRADKLPSIIREKCGTTAGSAAHQWYKEIICPSCKIARRVYSRYIYLKNFERIQSRDKAKRDADPEKYRTRSRKWIKDNPDKKREMSRTDYLKNLEKRKIAHAEWKSNNKDTLRGYDAKRRARKYNAPSEPYTTQDILNLWGTDCHLCREPINLNAPHSYRLAGWQLGLHLDHVIPLSRGGSNLISNIKPSHAQCNLRKNARLVV